MEQSIVNIEFNADSAYAFCAAQCNFGPRVMNSEAHEQCAQWIQQKFAQYGYRVWNIQNSGDVNADANKAIEATADFFRKIGIPASLKELDSRITDEHFEQMADHISKAWWDLKLSFAPIDRDGIVTILRNSL